MIKVERKQKLMWKLNPSVFQVINKEILYAVTRPLGTGVSAVSTMTSSGEEMKAYLPELVGASPDNTAVDWQAKVEKYWHAFHLDVPIDGYDMDTSLEISYYGRYAQNIDKYIKENKVSGVSSAEEIEAFMAKEIIKLTSFGNRAIPENEVYKYARPTNMEQYLEWRYCLVSNQVANRPEDVDKSSNIRFYLHDDEVAKRRKEEENSKFKKALTLYNKLISDNVDKSAYGNILYVYAGVPLEEITAMDLDDLQIRVGKMPYEHPELLIRAIEDKNIKDKAKVLRYIHVGLLRKVDNSDAIIDATTLASIGSNLEDVVAYLGLKENEVYAAELKAKYAALKK